METSILFQEIQQQPEVLDELISSENSKVVQIAKGLEGKFRYVIISARGTSDNAARYAQYLFGAHNHLQVALSSPSLFTLYNSPPNLAEALVIGISQSGKSPDLLAVMEEAKHQGRPTLALVNDIGSPMASIADFVIPLHAWPEKAIAATKSYTASLGALALLSCAMAGNTPRQCGLSNLPKEMENTLSGLSSSLQHVERYRFMEHCAVLGRGYNYSSAFEIALKIKELSRVVAEPYSTADFLHGPIATVHNGFPVILVAPQGLLYEDTMRIKVQLQSLEAETMIVSNDKAMLSGAQLPLSISNHVPEWLSPLVAVLPGQLFAWKLAIVKGLNPDNPEGLSKVTRTY